MNHQPFPPDTTVTTLPYVLRRATLAAHHRIDHHPFLAPLVRAELTVDHYLRILDFFQRFYEELQPVIEEATHQLNCDYELGDRLAWLKDDLASLEHTNPLPALDMELPRPYRPAHLVGWLYVIEGSTQGGQIIARQLQTSLQLTASHGARFFHGWGEATPRHWQDYWGFANLHCPPESYETVTASALELFIFLEDALESIVHAHSWK